jgi:hypothetical protein
MALNEAEVSLREYPSGIGVVIFDIDPTQYDPFRAPIRGSSTKTLDGCVVHQFFNLQQKDQIITLQGSITELDTMQALWSKYRSGAGGTEFELRDWYDNRFRCIFTPGEESFHPIPISGSLTAFTYTMNLTVRSILQWFGGSY